MNPWDEIDTAADKLDKMAAAADDDLNTNPYWGSRCPTRFADGINNACGGAAGELAAMFNPDLARLFARRLRAVGEAWPRHVAVTTTASAAAGRAEVLAMARNINGTTKATTS
ncbi:hypothetical protein ACGFNU_21605 [Spirillospora sp. NPDC048911]|uniref:hypothetical protein n=1 Tax=Spirillospora sp. NPDC048911 TaxID=3364527 RepID=UPI00371CC856